MHGTTVKISPLCTELEDLQESAPGRCTELRESVPRRYTKPFRYQF